MVPYGTIFLWKNPLFAPIFMLRKIQKPGITGFFENQLSKYYSFLLFFYQKGNNVVEGEAYDDYFLPL